MNTINTRCTVSFTLDSDAALRMPRGLSWNQITSGLVAWLLATASMPVWAAPADVVVDDDYSLLSPGTAVNWPYTGIVGAYQMGNDAFATIQDAVNAVAAGGTVRVAAGLYTESQILIAKSVQVLGAGEAVTMIDGGNAALSTPGVVRITTSAGDVRFDGFRVRNPGAASGIRAAISAGSSASGNTYWLSRNRLIGTGVPTEDRDHGLYSVAGQEHLVFETNTVTETGGPGLWVERHPGPVDIGHNTLDAGVWGRLAIGLVTYDHTDVTTAQRIAGNSIDLGTGGPFDPAHACVGITVAGAYTGTPGRFTDVQITDNTITRVMPYRRGINLANFAPAGQPLDGEISAAVVTQNTITGADSTETAGIRLTGWIKDSLLSANSAMSLLAGVDQVEYNGHSASNTTVGPLNNLRYNIRGVDIEAGTAAVRNNSVTNNTVNIWGYGPTAKVLVESNDLRGMFYAGLLVGGGAQVDAGDCLNRNATGLGSSRGGNNLTGFGFDETAPHAIDSGNFLTPAVLAYDNDFGATASDDLEKVIVDDTDYPWLAPVEFSQTGPLLVACPPAISVTVGTPVPAGATTLADFRAQGGLVSSSPATVSYSDGPLTPGPTQGTITRTYTITDPCGQTVTCIQNITVTDTDTEIVLGCPANMTVNADPGQCSAVVVYPPPTVSGNCGAGVIVTCDPASGVAFALATTRVTCTATCGNVRTNCAFSVTVIDGQPPRIECPPDVILPCADCNTDPGATGTPTVTDSCRVRLTYRDVTNGVCPKVVTRTWQATDESGNTATCVQTITCLPSSLVTDSSRCLFDRDPATSVQDFRLVFTQDPQNWPCYRLGASNPGQFIYNVFYTGRPGERVSFDVTVPYPFVTQGANPVHAYDWVYVAGGNGLPCLLPGNAFFVSAQQVTLAGYGNPPQPAARMTITLTVPDSGVVFLAIHLDYGLKKQSGYAKNAAGDAVDCATGAQVLIPNHGSYEFAVSGAQNGATRIQNVNVFKKNPGVAGLILNKNSTDPAPGTTVALVGANGTRFGSSVADEDGFYMIAYRHKGKAATYYLSIVAPTGYKETKPVTLKANAFVDVGFLVP